MAIQGVFTSNSGIAGDQIQSFSNSVYKSSISGTAPLLALTSGMQRKTATSTIINWFEESASALRTTITNIAGTGTTFVVSDASGITAKTVAVVESTNEYIYIADVAGTTLTVVRGFAQSTVTSINGSTTPVGLQLIGRAYEEGSDAPNPEFKVGLAVMNYTQIFRNSFGITRTAKKIDWHTGDQSSKNKADAVSKHAKMIEAAILFGRKAMFTINGVQTRTMDGLLSFIKTNVEHSVDGKVTLENLEDFMERVFRFNLDGAPNERIAFCGNQVLVVINRLARKNGTINIEVGQTEWGLKINKLISPFGDLVLMTHPLFNESPKWRKGLLVLHPAAMSTHYITDADVDAIEGDGVDGEKGVITSELTIEYNQEITAGVFTNIETAVLESEEEAAG